MFLYVFNGLSHRLQILSFLVRDLRIELLFERELTTRGEYQLTDAIRLVIQGGGKVYGVRLRADERRYDVGNFDSYFQAFVEFSLADEKHGPALRKYLKSIL